MNCANDWMHFYGYFLIFIPDTSTRKAHTPKAKQGEGLSVCYGTTDLFHGDRFRQIPRLAHIFSFEHGDVVSQQLQGYRDHNRSKVFLHFGDFKAIVANCLMEASSLVAMAERAFPLAITQQNIDFVHLFPDSLQWKIRYFRIDISIKQCCSTWIFNE